MQTRICKIAAVIVGEIGRSGTSSQDTNLRRYLIRSPQFGAHSHTSQNYLVANIAQLSRNCLLKMATTVRDMDSVSRALQYLYTY